MKYKGLECEIIKEEGSKVELKCLNPNSPQDGFNSFTVNRSQLKKTKKKAK